MRTIQQIHQAQYHLMGDLQTYTPLPQPGLDQIDPFLLLNHHGPQEYRPQNHGLPFGPHPHRGMQTVTLILQGDIMHQDSGGHKSVIGPGGVQWMVAGSGLIHSEVSSPQFKEKGGPLEILQLWVNLPARLKMTDPWYKGLQKEDIPTLQLNEKVSLQLISGNWYHQPGAFTAPMEVHLATVDCQKDGTLNLDIPRVIKYCYML